MQGVTVKFGEKNPLYLHGMSYSQLTIPKITQYKILGPATSDSVIHQSSSNNIQTYVGKFNPDTCAKNRWFIGCVERNAPLGLVINHIIILSPGQA
jgi:hypothetical protein